MQKHVLDVAWIARALKDRGVPFRIEIAGDGEARDQLVALMKDLDIEEQVMLLGFQDRENVAALLPRSSVNLCLHGGVSRAEAAVVERHSVAYDWAWQSEVIVDGPTGRQTGKTQ